MRQALDEMRAELQKLPQLYPSRRVLQATYAALEAASRRIDDLDILVQTREGKRLTDE